MTNDRPPQTTNVRNLGPGKWQWSDGIGFRKNNSGNGGTWYIKYRAPVAPSSNSNAVQVLKQVKERLPNCRNRSQAEGVLMARKAAIFEGTYQRKRKVEPTTIKTFAKRFLETKRHLKTLKKYRQQLDQYIIPFFGSRSLEHITGSECLEFYNKRLDSGSAISTVNGEVACLKSLFSESIRSGLVQINPVKGIKLLNPNNARDRILSDEETARLFWAASQMQDFVRPLFHVLFNTGMRLGEALALEWSDIEFDHQRIIIRHSKSGEGRRIPLRPSLADELILWKPQAHGSQWVFPGRDGTDVHIQSIRKGWLRLCKAAAISNMRIHDLRHNFTSQLQAAGVSDSIIMAITGHKTHVMLHRYSHANDEHKRKALDVLPTAEHKPDGNVITLLANRS